MYSAWRGRRDEYGFDRDCGEDVEEERHGRCEEQSHDDRYSNGNDGKRANVGYMRIYKVGSLSARLKDADTNY